MKEKSLIQGQSNQGVDEKHLNSIVESKGETDMYNTGNNSSGNNKDKKKVGDIPCDKDEKLISETQTFLKEYLSNTINKPMPLKMSDLIDPYNIMKDSTAKDGEDVIRSIVELFRDKNATPVYPDVIAGLFDDKSLNNYSSLTKFLTDKGYVVKYVKPGREPIFMFHKNVVMVEPDKSNKEPISLLEAGEESTPEQADKEFIVEENSNVSIKDDTHNTIDKPHKPDLVVSLFEKPQNYFVKSIQLTQETINLQEQLYEKIGNHLSKQYIQNIVYNYGLKAYLGLLDQEE